MDVYIDEGKLGICILLIIGTIIELSMLFHLLSH